MAVVILPGEQDGVTIAEVALDRMIKPGYSALTNQSQYLPAEGDIVIAIVTRKWNDCYRLHIYGPNDAYLKFTNFQGASKNNYPTLQPGSVVLTGILPKNQSSIVDCTCITKLDNKSFETKQTYLGPLSKGYLHYIGIPYANILQADDCALLYMIGIKAAYEISVGANGFIYVISKSLEAAKHITDTIVGALKCTDYVSLHQYIEKRFEKFH